MRDPRIPLKSSLVAGLLAFLFPGAGHWYQGRRFKATIYSVGIMTLFVWGMILGNWQPVYSELVYRGRADTAQLEFNHPQLKMSFGYAAQFLVGAPALPSLVQDFRFRNATGKQEILDSEINSDFSGIIESRGDDGELRKELVAGRIVIIPAVADQPFAGTLTVVDKDGIETEYEVESNLRLGRAIFGSPRREIRCDLVDKAADETGSDASLQGTIPRSFQDWFQAPRDTHELDQLHGDLNRRFDIASVFTWIAGLLNLLAIWDAADGPAYAYGDEKPEKEEEEED